MTEAARRILIVEDQRLIAADLENTLRKLGYVVVGNVSSGEDAISTSDQVRPELVLMDVRLRGDMDGIHAAQIIRDQFNVPVVFLTAYADEETILRAKKTTPYGYLVKPFNERELRATIEIAFYTHQMERTLADERARRQGAEEFQILVDGVKDYAIFRLDVNLEQRGGATQGVHGRRNHRQGLLYLLFRRGTAGRASEAATGNRSARRTI